MFSPNETKMLDQGLKPLQQSFYAPISEGLLVTRYDQLSKHIVEAEKNDLIIGLPHVSDSQKKYDKERLLTISDRLFNLGYLSKTAYSKIKQRKRLDENFKMAVKEFQKEATLVNDGWVGDKTWLALQQLVTFEEPTRVEQWLTVDKEPSTPLIRSAQLRLYVLGLSDKKPIYKQDPVNLDLSEFYKICLLFGFFNTEDMMEDNELLELLLDQDRIVYYLSQSMLNLKGSDHKTAQHFLIAVTKIELWLLNANNIRPNGQLTEEHRFPIGPKKGKIEELNIIRTGGHTLRTRSYFYRGVKKIWESVSGHEYKNEAKAFLNTYPQFFRLLNELEVSSDDEVGKSIDNFISQDSDHIKTLWQTAKGFMGKLFDGLKRIGRFIKKILGYAKDIVLWLARPFYNTVVNGFRVMKMAIKVTMEGLQFYFSKVLAFQGMSRAFAIKDKDCDLTIFADNNHPSEVSLFSHNLVLLSKRLQYGSVLISSFLSLLKHIFDTSIFGWWAFFKACLELYQNRKTLIKSFVFLESHQLSIDII